MITQRQHSNGRMTALITGAAGGLGRAFAVECASRGWDLFLTDILAAPLETLDHGLMSQSILRRSEKRGLQGWNRAGKYI